MRPDCLAGKTLLMLACLIVGCEGRKSPSAATTPPATSKVRPTETALSTITLTAEAEKRLGIEIGAVEKRATPATLTVPGEVMVPTGGSVVLTAPFSATVSGSSMPKAGATVKRGQTLLSLAPFAPPDRDVRAQAEKSVTIASAQLATVTAKIQRLEKLLAEGGASEKQLEEARAERDVVQAELTAAQRRLGAIRRAPLGADVSIALPSPRDGLVRSVSVAPGQVVAAGAPLFEIMGAPTLWVRVSVYAGEADRILPTGSAQIGTLGQTLRTGQTVVALPVSAPPSADPVAATVDFYYELPAETKRRPGERVVAFLPTNGTTDLLAVPFSAVVFDATGGAWVYAEATEHAYERRRIDVARIEDHDALFAMGPAAATRIVRAGASELFGVEFGVGK